MGDDQLFADAAGDERREHRPRAGRTEGVEPTLIQIGDARGGPEAEQMRQGEGVIADAAAVGVMGGDAGVDRSDSLARPAGREVLAVRAGHIGGVEKDGERLPQLGIDRDRERMTVGFLAQMPCCRPASCRWLTTEQASAIRVRPRLVASASTAVSMKRRSSAGAPERRCVKAPLKPVQRSPSASRLVMRRLGIIPYSRSARASASAGVTALSGEIFSSPPVIRTSSSLSAAALALTSARRRSSGARRSVR